MKRLFCLLLLAGSTGFGFVSCADTAERAPVGPPSSGTSKIPWNSPIAGQGQGQMGMMPQNQYRR
ncbi:MAG: hypothetical protein WED15_02700 [Akkermansiaceae bacterium]